MATATADATTSDTEPLSSTRDRTRPGRPRSERRRAAVLAATLDELACGSIRSMTIEAIADRAGVSKVTIYRWWPDKVALTLDALYELPELAVPDTGALHGDLATLRERLVELIENSRLADVLPALIAERHRAEHHDAISAYLGERSAPYRQIVDRAVARGELPADVDPDLLAHLFASPLSHSMLLRDTLLDDSEWAFAVRVVAAGVHTEASSR